MLKARIDGLVAEKLAADSKATHFYLECAGLLRQTRARERDKARALARLSEAQAKVRLYFCPYFYILAAVRASWAPPRAEFLLSCDDHWTLTGPAHTSGGPCGAWLRQNNITNPALESDNFNTAHC